MVFESEPIVVIGIDCSTDPAKIGLARAEFLTSGLRVTNVESGRKDRSASEIIATWLRGTARGLLALDSPLGWSSFLAESLPDHRAGERLVGDANRLFHRLTDDFVYSQIGGTRPLEVGANLIARTAHAALALLDRIRIATHQAIPLAWESDLRAGISAIEVYPAATLRSYGFLASGYKTADQADRREKLVSQLSPLLLDRLDAFRTALIASDDALDAVVCTIAGADFLRGDAMPPTIHPDIARKEGWIWVRGRKVS